MNFGYMLRHDGIDFSDELECPGRPDTLVHPLINKSKKRQ